MSWLLFELTANATLSVMVACLKFGWEDFRTARWLRRADPDLPRATACSWFYVASGVWKTAVMPILLIMILSVLWAVFLPRAAGHRVLREQLASAVIVGLGAAVVLILVVAVAVGYAWTHRVRVWVHHELHASRRQQQWPPRWHGGFWQHDNRGRAILATALIFVTVGAPPLLFRLVLAWDPLPETVATLAIVFGPPIAATLTYAVLRDRIFAHVPEECWPSDEACAAS